MRYDTLFEHRNPEVWRLSPRSHDAAWRRRVRIISICGASLGAPLMVLTAEMAGHFGLAGIMAGAIWYGACAGLFALSFRRAPWRVS